MKRLEAFRNDEDALAAELLGRAGYRRACGRGGLERRLLGAHWLTGADCCHGTLKRAREVLRIAADRTTSI